MSRQSMGAVYKLLEFLKKNTDKDHPATQAKLREIAGDELAGQLMGDKGTFSRRLNELADVYNRDEGGDVKSKEEWRLVYQGYNKESANGKNGKIYYAHEVSDYEMDFLVQQIRATHNLTRDEKISLEKRLTDALCSRYYEYSENALIREMPLPDETEKAAFEGVESDELEPENLDELEGKLRIVREHIRSKKMLEIMVDVEKEYDDDDEDEKPVRAKKRNRTIELDIRVSPYMIVHQAGHYWLIGNRHERPRKDAPWNYYTEALTAYRIDKINYMMTAHTPDETTIHWTMTKSMMPGKPFTRYGAGRETKARYNKEIAGYLEKFYRMDGVELKHGRDL